MNFGTLTKKEQNNIKPILNKDTLAIDYLFRNSQDKLEKMTVIAAEREIALNNLRNLTQELKNQRLAYSSDPKFRYFTV